MATANSTVDIEPNILIIGSPGTGKSYLCQRLAERLCMKWHECSQIAKEKDFLEGYHKELDCPIINEDKLMDYLKPYIQQGKNIVEYHGCAFFPMRWFQAVFVVTCPNKLLYDRLKARGLNEQKIRANIECENFRALMDEARGFYNLDHVFELHAENRQDVETNITTVRNWFSAWRRK